MRTGLDGGFALADTERPYGDAAFVTDIEHSSGSEADCGGSDANAVCTPPDAWPGCVVASGLAGTVPHGFGADPRGADEAILLPFGASPDGVALLDDSGLVLAANPRAIGSGMGTGGRASWLDGWDPPEGRAAAQAALAGARAGHPARFRAAAGPACWDVTVTPVAGPPMRFLAVARDVTEQRQAEARQGVLLMEMEHRLKNTLAIVQAIATQTLRNAPSLPAAAESLGARMLALAQAHDVLMQGAWASASLRGLVEGAVRLHGDGMPERFRIVGPEVTVGPRPALTLALMLHELGTNAGKYGALSNETGQVAIGWRIAGRAGAEWLWFHWAERGGPPVAPPSRSGFGSRLIERSLVHSFGGSARLRYPRSGAVMALVAPLSAVAAEGGAA
ncbi:two-component sensor histidine kinase [Methylorubrum rhodinum]|uniref:histidine kinase n=1 Tax=Methylorubrum rhodinum TaxID=29428 RepID=A0A840ZRN5_9HYPH|nr:sensor histidine kinase [Methylorubrum rhodinum]MBB5760010.1 two-component sensor histidine kinase [Methylorubrum rhodinum]